MAKRKAILARKGIFPNDPRFPLTAPKEPSEKVAGQEKFVLRLPAGMRDRIKTSAARNKRSMNTELIYALEALYPPEPDIFDVMEHVHGAIRQAQHSDGLPYRDHLIKALDQLSERLSSGLEFDQYRTKHIGPMYDRSDNVLKRMDRWRRVQDTGVEQVDLEREIARGMFRHMRGDTVRAAIEYFQEGKPERALRVYRVHEVKFADPEAAHKAIEADLRAYYEDNWGDINEPAPWEDEE